MPLDKYNVNVTSRIVLLEAQLDAARSQALHYEAKLTVTADYEQIKNSLISMETERKQLLVNLIIVIECETFSY